MKSWNYQMIRPSQELAFFVDSFWMLHNLSDKPEEVIILPDGRVDLFFSISMVEPFHISLQGISTRPEQASILPGTKIFAISLKLPAAEYILHESIAHLADNVKLLPGDFWGFNAGDIEDFDLFCRKANDKLMPMLPEETDNRKLELFNLIYTSNGSIPVQELSGKIFWSSRQINRYFTQQFGISLKAYCNILRFRASFGDISQGKLFPQDNFSDQPHFIKEVKKFAGVSPRELKRNQNDRFIQFSTLPRK